MTSCTVVHEVDVVCAETGLLRLAGFLCLKQSFKLHLTMKIRMMVGDNNSKMNAVDSRLLNVCSRKVGGLPQSISETFPTLWHKK